MDKKEKNKISLCRILDEHDAKRETLANYEKMDMQFLYIDVPLLFPLLQDIPKADNNTLIQPSDFIREMTMNTEERQQHLLKIHRLVKCADVLSNSFKVLPDIVIFQNCLRGEYYTVPLTIINVTEVSKPLQIIFHDSYFFSMRHSRREVSTKVAPGLPYQLFIVFSPDQDKDYQHKITINSDDESFHIPILAIGPRPLLDFPNEINLPSIPVKIETERTIIIHNLGAVSVIFRMNAPPPFTIEPRNGVLKDGESIRLKIKYKPLKVGIVEETLTVLYESGETLGIKLKGYAEDLSPMDISRTFVPFEDTYMGLTRQETIEFRNTSRHILKYAWKRYSSRAEDKTRWQELRGNMDAMRTYHEARSNLLEYHNICSGDAHMTICERMLHDEIDDMEIQGNSGDVGGPLYFGYDTSGIFEIVPDFGEIWPNASITFTIIFKPENALCYCRTVYFDISGTEKRTQVCFRGTGLGPAFELNMQTLDAQNIFLCASHKFEIIAHNKGIIPGTIGFAKKQWDFGAEITFHTEDKFILPGEIGAFIFEFHSRIQGRFVEEINFVIRESLLIVKMVMRGNVICPLLAFDVGEVNFGSISLGVPYVKKFNLLNNCQVPIEFSCSMENDGEEHAIVCEEFIKMEVKELPENPKEFHVSPLNGTVIGYSSVTVTITLISNAVKHLSTIFKLNMWGSNNYKETLSVFYQSDIPHIICKTPELHVNGCFINYPYNRSVILKNESEFSGVILVDMQKALFCDGIKYTCPVTDFFIQPYGEVKVAMTLVTNILGESRATLAVRVFGSRKYSLSVAEIICSGIGPSISFQPDAMDFENISTLTEYSAPITINNDSAITATVDIVNHSKVCRVDKTHLIIEPNQIDEVVVSIYLKVACKFHEKLKVKIEDGDIMSYTIRAIATGTSILCTPKLEPELNLGYLYTNKPFALDVILKNLSQNQHKIFWSRLKYLKSFNIKEISECAISIPSIFSMTPVNFDLAPSNSVTVKIEGCCTKPDIVEEDFYCHAIVGKDKKSVIMSYILKANFVTPCVLKNKQKFHFRQDLGVEVTVNFLEDVLTLFNDSKLPVAMELIIKAPFYLKSKEGFTNLYSLSLEDQEEESVTIAYEPEYAEKRCFKDNGILHIKYVDLPTTDQIPIMGEVNFPTIKTIPNKVDFGCLAVGTDSYVLVTMRNISPLKVHYFTEFSEDDFERVIIEVHNMEAESSAVQQPDIVDTISNFNRNAIENTLASVTTIPDEGLKCGYKLNDDWIECEKLFCNCKPNQYRNIKTILKQIMPSKEEKQVNILNSFQSLPNIPQRLSELHQVLDVNPTAGYLDPYECTVLTIAFKPFPNTQIAAKLQIAIQAGETEVLPIVGKCADITYTLDECVEFGVQLFCETSERSLHLKNTSYEAVLYTVHHDPPEDMPAVNGWPQGFYTITPNTGSLEPNDSINLNVKYFPGHPGEFAKNVVIKIGHFKPMEVRLHGYAVFPQIYVSNYFNFATSRNEEDPTIGYNAIATLSLDYLLLVNDWKVNQPETPANISINTEALSSLFTDDWEVVVYHSLYPTERDIDLAIERYLASAVTSSNPPPLKDHVVQNRAMFIPRFAVQAYHLDFGLVIINSEVQLSVPIECYVHYNVELRLVGTQSLAKISDQGLTLVFKKMKLCPGEIKTFYVIFKPTALIFTEPDVEMSVILNFIVAHGPIIPMKISAFVTTPKARTSTTYIDFGDVICGTAVCKSMIIENSGRVVCKWAARLMNQRNKPVKIFMLRDSSGVLQPGESAFIYITFQPECDGPAKCNLEISMDDNPDLIDVKLKAIGIESKLTIEENLVLFNPVLPYSYHESYITIKNNGIAPMEFLFSDFDKQFEEENIILRLLMKFYNLDVLYIPPRTPGSPLPQPLIDFYNLLQENTLEWITQMKDEFPEMSNESLQNRSDAISLKSCITERSKVAILAKLNHSLETLDAFYEKREEIIADYIKLMRDLKSENLSKLKIDPIAQTIAEAKVPEPLKDPTDMREGVLLIFIGAPFTDAVQVANRTSIVLKLPVLNVNDLIYQSLLRNDTLAAIKINDILNEMCELMEPLPDPGSDISDPYDTLIQKMDLILTGKLLEKRPKSDKSTKKSKGSSKSKSSKSKSSKSKSSKGKIKTKKQKVPKSKASVKSPKNSKKKKTKSDDGKKKLNIPIELLFEVLQNSLLTYEDGLIIESLDSHFIKEPTLALNSILRAIGNIRYIQIITLFHTWDNHLKFEDEKREKQKQKEEEELALKIKFFEDMDAVEFEQMTPEDWLLFRKYVLAQRREVTKFRVGIIGRRHSSRIMLRKQRRKKLADSAKKSLLSEKQMSTNKTDKKSSKASKGTKKSKDSKKSKVSKKSKGTKGSKSATNKSKTKMGKSGKGSSAKGEKRTITTEEKVLKTQFDNYQHFYCELLHLVEFWNRKTCDVIKPYITTDKKGQASKKKSKSKSSRGSAKTSAKKTIPPKKSEEKEAQPISLNVIEDKDGFIDKIQLGIPCWIFDNAYKMEMTQQVADYLKDTSELKSARLEIIDSKMNKPLVETTEYFSVLYNPKNTTEKNVSDVFKISDAEPLQDPISTDVIDLSTTTTVSKQSMTKSRKKSISKKSKLSFEAPTLGYTEQMPDTSLQNPMVFFDAILTPRAVIHPNESIRYKILYHPTFVGESRHIFTIETVGWPRKYELNCFGTADIPRILNDPNALFANQIANANLTPGIKNREYIPEADIFDFGYVLIRQVNDDPKLLMKEADFKLINHSLLPCITKIYLKDTDNDVFSLEQNEIIISPNNSVSLKVYANPYLELCFENGIYICVRDNPEVYIINMRCTGCVPQMTVHPNVVSFDRVLYQTTEKRIARLQNDSPVSLRWYFPDVREALQVYKFAPICGIIAGNSNQQLEFVFTGEATGPVAPVKLSIEVVDDEAKVKNPLITEHLLLTAEVIDVTIEYETHVKLGDIRGKIETIFEYHMVNHATYDVEYIFTPIEVPDLPALRTQRKAIEMTKMLPNRGILKPNKPFTAHIHIMPISKMDLQQMPVMACQFRETAFNQPIAQFNLVLSGRIHLSTFELCPQSEILFGRQLVESEQIQNLSIKNTGKFSFTYKVVSLATFIELQKKMSDLKNSASKSKDKKKKHNKSKKKGKGSKEKSKSTKSTKDSKKSKSNKSKKTNSTKSKKSKDSKKSKVSKKSKKSKKSKSDGKSIKSKTASQMRINVGVFTIVPGAGVVEPGETKSIKIISKPIEVRSYDETILFFVSEPRYADRLGRPVQLKCLGQIPNLSLDNFDEIFKEHFVVDKMTDLVCSEQLACNLVFVKVEKTLYFNKVCINTEKPARIKITNTSMIHTEVFAKIISGSGTFTVIPPMLVIEGYSSNYFITKFKPTAIETFNAMLEVSYNSMSSFQAETLTVKLVGDGYVPEITLLCPLLAKESNIYELHYDSVMVGDTMRKSLIVENVGAVACQVLCSIGEDNNDEFVIVPPTMAPVLRHSDTDVVEYKDHLFDMKVRENVTLEIEYKPKTEPTTKSKLKLHIFNNPYEIFTIILNGESYKEDIKLENIEMFTYRPEKPPPPSTKKRNSKLPPPPPPVTYSKPCYDLNFGHISVHRLEKRYFNITNTSDSYTYKFELGNISNLLFIPAVGHLKPKASKQIIATFLTKEPIIFNREILNCKFYKIDYVLEDIDPLSWDERQNFVLWSPAVCSLQNYNSEINVPPETEFSTDEENDVLNSNVKIKTVEGKVEPLYEEVPDSSRNLNIFFSVISDYSRLYCSITELVFEDTLLFEKRKMIYSVYNKSNIPIVMNWQVLMDEYPKRISIDNEPKSLLSDNKGNDQLKAINNPKKIEAKRPQTSAPYLRGLRNRPRPAPLTKEEKTITNPQCPSRPSTARSSLFSSSSGGSSRTRDSWCDADELPFTIQPQSFAIPPQESKVFTVTFAPNDVYQFSVRIKCNVDNLAPDEKSLDIAVTGRSLLPLYYFNIEPTDYLARRKRSGKRTCEDLVDENTRIIEFEAIGLHKVIKTFTVINPTGEVFAYRWIPHHLTQLSNFRCHTTEGVVSKGKMVEAIFSFLPQTEDTIEDYYEFYIEGYDLKALFLLVGTTRQPCVFFNTPSVSMKPTVIGIDVFQSVELVNKETFELVFKFVSSSFWGEKRLQRLTVEPKSGVLKPDSQTRIKIMYHPTAVEESNFYIKCEVERRAEPCVLCVITNCFAVEPIVEYVDNVGSKVALHPLKMNTMEFKDVPPMHKYRVPVFVENIGRTGFYYNWTVKDKYCADSMKISFNEKEGYVKYNTVAETSFSITALKYLKKRRAHITLEVLYGPSFPITVICSSSKITYKFSFEEYNFGPCLVQLEKSMYYKINLQFTNLETAPIILDYASEQQNHLTVCFKASEVSPKATETIQIYFHPMQIKDYEDDIIFYVNSKLHTIKIRGLGVPVLLELEDFRDKYIDLGSPYKGTIVQKTIKVVNNSLCSVRVAVNLYDRLPIFNRPSKDLAPLYEFLELSTSEISFKAEIEKKGSKKGGKKKRKRGKSKSSKGSKKSSKGSKKSKKSKSSSKNSKSTKKSMESSKKSNKGKQKSKGSSKKSKGSKHKKSGSSKGSKKKHKKHNKKDKKQSALTDLIETPREETPEEKEKRQIRESVQITPKAFITIQPKKAAEFILKFAPTERIPAFMEKIFYEIQDHVDILCMFKGTSLASDYYLERDYITFANVIKGCKTDGKLTLFNIGDIGGRFKWSYDKYDESVSLSPMEGYISTNANVVFTLTFTPTVVQCVTQAKLKCTIDNFDKTLDLLVNSSCSDYPAVSTTVSFICPVRTSTSHSITVENIFCEHWTIHPVITLPVFEGPGKLLVEPQSSCTFEVTYRPLSMTKELKDIAMLILQTPNGQVTLYQLEGQALRPEAIPIKITIPCKQEYIHILPINNWLRVPQVFKVINEVLPTESNTIKTLYKLTGNEYIEVPALGERNYNWIINVINEGNLHFKTKIRHEPSGEYIVYEIFVTITKCASLDEIHLVSCVRQTKACKLKFENPIGTPVDCHFNTNASNLKFLDFVKLRPYSEYFLDILYTPLIASDSKIFTFEAATQELGVFPYTFYLTAGTAIPEKMVTIEAPLGTEKSQKISLENLSDTKADFIAKFDDPSLFYLPSSISIGPKEKNYFEIFFEPSTLGAVESKLLLTSSAAGEYIYPLKGIGILPKSQGPFFAKSGGTINIPIKNPFSENKTFIFETNSANFDVKPRIEMIKAKQTYKIVVNVTRNTKQDSYINAYPLTGKLTVTCNDATYSDLKWVYYLQAD